MLARILISTGLLVAPLEAQCQLMIPVPFCGTDFNIYVDAMMSVDWGLGPELWIGGANFFTSSTTLCTYLGLQGVARWNGSTWVSPGGGLTPLSSFNSCQALCEFDDGSGRAIYVGGRFSGAVGVSSPHLVRWNGTAWSSLGLVGGFEVSALCVYDDGSGAALYVGGSFTAIAGVPARNLARWNGTAWSSVGDLNGPVRTLTVFDDGAGPRLAVGGNFTVAGGTNASCIALYDGTSWSALGAGLQGSGNVVESMVVFDDGAGPELIAGGTLVQSGSTTLRGIARWNGTAWSALGNANFTGTAVKALQVWDEASGHGDALYVAGNFQSIVGGMPSSGLARWQGGAWSAIGPYPPVFVDLRALVVHPNAATQRTDLFVAGRVVDYGPGPQTGFWRLTSCTGPGAMFCHGHAPTAACPCGGTTLAPTPGGCSNSAGTPGVLRALGNASISSDNLVLDVSGLPAASVAVCIQGSSTSGAGSGASFGDGVQCAGGSLVRIGSSSLVGGRTRFPAPGAPSISLSGAVIVPGGRVYQVLYRDALGLCSSSNTTNALRMSWGL